MNDRDKTALGLGLLGLGVLVFMNRKTLSSIASAAIDIVNDEIFSLSIPRAARPYADVIKQVAQETGVDPFLIVALGDQETRWGTIYGANGTTGPSIIGADGTGHGLMQIDSGTWGAWLDANDWEDPYTNIKKGAEIFLEDLDYFAQRGLSGDAQILAALAAYNHGPDNVWHNVSKNLSPDTGTTHGNYASTVWTSFVAMSTAFAAAVSSPSDQLGGWQDAGAARRRGGSGKGQV
jgi:soluble lytic murein transglycosylase-like protein